MRPIRFQAVRASVPALACLLAASASAGNLVVNGGFEQGVVTGDFQIVPAGDPFITGWEVVGNSVDVITAPRWVPANGVQSIDLAGTPGPGEVRQTLPTKAGRTYRVSFALSSNDERDGDKSVIFRWGSSTQTLLGDEQNKWKYFTFELIAESDGTVISFASTITTTAGGVVDDVVVKPCTADFNDDGFVTGDDFDAFVAAFVVADPKSDINEDGFVTGEDFDVFVGAFQSGC